MTWPAVANCLVSFLALHFLCKMLWWTSCFWLVMQVLWSISTISCCPCIFDKIFLSCVSRLHIFLIFSSGTNQRNCKKERTKCFTWPKSSDLFVTKPEIMSLEQIPIGSAVEAILDMTS
jgi:hypothetical protein